ncbi:hypothetical protein MPOCJGCO_1302 [Methylobacterium trifolii]|uniref:Uncharacterized protein n=1 Tax=Methylobacterium trifolii TaxID=1003092 RepID=A0ABQ4TWD9_9HYPH|nr:hypothetical protein MPOCJGCO_1302 [Methylobacterium trifolii]
MISLPFLASSTLKRSMTLPPVSPLASGTTFLSTRS